MATEQIPTSIIADDAITTAKVADDAITGALIENNPTIAGTLNVTGAFTAAGGIANAGTITAGTLGSSVVVPASIGGGEVLLNTYTADNSSNILAITGMSTTYSTYKFVMSGLKFVNDNIKFYWYLKKADGTVRTSSYRTSSYFIWYNGSADGSGQNSFSDTLFGTPAHIGNDGTINGVFYVFEPANTSKMTHGTAIWNYKSHNDYNYNSYGGGQYHDGGDAHTAINLQTESGNWLSGTVKMYGIK